MRRGVTRSEHARGRRSRAAQDGGCGASERQRFRDRAGAQRRDEARQPRRQPCGKMEAAGARVLRAGGCAGERPAARDERAPRGAPAGAAKPRNRVRPPVALNAIHARSADQAPGIVTEGRDTAMSNREEAWLGGAERAIEPGARNARAQEIILCISFDCGELAAQCGDGKFRALRSQCSSADARAKRWDPCLATGRLQ